MATDIPYAKLGISSRLEAQIAPTAPKKARLAIAKGLLPVPPGESLGALYALACQEDPQVRDAAIKGISEMPEKVLLNAISVKSHPKVLEFIAEFRPPSDAVDERIGMLRTANDRTAVLIASRASASVCELLARNQERLLTTPAVFVELHANPNCSDAVLERANSFLRMHRSLPDVPEVRPFLAGGDEMVEESAADTAPAAPAQTSAPAQTATPTSSPAMQMDLMAEVEAALRGEQSPAFVQAQQTNLEMFSFDEEQASAGGPGKTSAPGEHEGFTFDFSNDNDGFSWDLTGDHNARGEDRGELKRSLEQKIADMSVGHKIKLAYLGNKESRSILIRDKNKVVAGAVVKSGRLTDQEVASYAGNKNLDGDVLREIANNKEFTRKYPVKVALVNNPKTPVSVAVGFVNAMQKKDLMMLTRNRNVPSVVTEAAQRLFRQKYRQ